VSSSYSARDRELLNELASLECRCGAPKEARRTLCRKCYYTLPPRLRAALYNKLHEGYLEARDEAVAFLLGREQRKQLRDGRL
jgi:hypothetical protein